MNHTVHLIDQVADQVVFINLAIVCWTGKQTLQPEDLGLDRRQLPPEALVRLGSKVLINPEELKVFTTQRATARRLCLEVGTRFLGGFIVPETKAQALLDQLDELAQAFNAERERFLLKFEQLVEAWRAENPAWAHLIRHSSISRQAVAERLSFAVQALKIAAPTTLRHPGLAQAATGLVETLFQEVGQLARETLEKSYLGKEAVTRRALRPLIAIGEKLDGLSFLDRRVQPIVRDIQNTLSSLPRQGPLQGRDLQALIGLLSILEAPERLKQHGEQLLAGQTPAAALWIEPPARSAEPAASTVDMAALPPVETPPEPVDRAHGVAEPLDKTPSGEVSPPAPAPLPPVETAETAEPATPTPAAATGWFF